MRSAQDALSILYWKAAGSRNFVDVERAERSASITADVAREANYEC
jgi:hypothetical protein